MHSSIWKPAPIGEEPRKKRPAGRSKKWGLTRLLFVSPRRKRIKTGTDPFFTGRSKKWGLTRLLFVSPRRRRIKTGTDPFFISVEGE
jgi:hypothetical protein